MAESKVILNERTLIPVGAIAAIIGASMWLTNIWFQGEANAQQIEEVKATEALHYEKIDVKLDKMNDKIDRLLERGDLK